MLRVIVVSLALLFAAATATNVKDCKNKPAPLSVDIAGCTEPPCDVVKGTTAIMDVHFVGTKNDMRNITTQIRATALGVTVPYELPTEVADVCSNLLYDATCPIYASEDVVYQLNFYIDSLYPEIGVKVEASLVDEDNDTVACFAVNIKVKKGPN